MKRSAVALLALLVWSGGCGKPPEEPWKGASQRLDVIVELGEDGPKIVDLSATRHDRKTPAPVAPGEAESTGPFVTLHAPDGSILYRVPVTAGRRPRSFEHTAHETPGALTGGRIEHEVETRVVSVPLIAGATHVGVGGEHRMELLHEKRGDCPPCVGQPRLLYPESERQAEEVLDIVIVGDGFHASEQAFFESRARLLTEGLLATEPFKRNADKLQFHMIPTVSKDSGVDDPTSGTQKDTCLDLTGGKIGCCGTDNPAKLWKALACRFPITQVDLRVVIANVPLYGGRGHSEVRAAYVNAYTPGKEKMFVAVATHEIGHALAGLADEYFGCDPVPDPKDLFANMATREQVENGTVPWLDLATPDELIDPEHFRYVYELPEDQADQCPTGIPKIPDEYDGKLGLFWGAMYVDGDKSICTQGCSQYSDPRGANYFRPMAHCKMRMVLHDYCRVCEREMERAILRFVHKKGLAAAEPEPPAAPTDAARTDAD